MTETSYPAPGVTQAQHERLMGGAAASGVFGHPADLPVVYAPNSGTREVRIRAGRRAVVEGYGWENNTTEVTLPSLAANGTGSTRIDLVVLRLDRSDWTVRAKVVQGTAGAGAPSPTTSPSTVWELPLAEVAVAPGATILAGSTVTNRAWYVGGDGQIRCTPTTRPSHENGRQIFDTTVGRTLVSDGVSWMIGVEDITPAALALSSGWNASVNRVQRRNGWVSAYLTVTRTGGNIAGGATVTMGTLPAGHRPTFTFDGVIFTGDSYGGYFTVASTTGVVSATFNGALLTGRRAIFQAAPFPA